MNFSAHNSYVGSHPTAAPRKQGAASYQGAACCNSSRDPYTDGPYDYASIGHVGKLFIALLKMMIAPMIALAIIHGLARMSGSREVGRMGAYTVVLYLATMAVAVATGLIFVNVFQPGAGSALAGSEFFEGALLRDRAPDGERAAIRDQEQSPRLAPVACSSWADDPERRRAELLEDALDVAELPVVHQQYPRPIGPLAVRDLCGERRRIRDRVR